MISYLLGNIHSLLPFIWGKNRYICPEIEESMRNMDKDLLDKAYFFVMANRMQKGYVHDYDIVYGPVANDCVYAAFALYEGRLISKQVLIAELRAYK